MFYRFDTFSQIRPLKGNIENPKKMGDEMLTHEFGGNELMVFIEDQDVKSVSSFYGFVF